MKKKYVISIDFDCSKEFVVIAKNQHEAKKKVYEKLSKQKAIKYVVKKDTCIENEAIWEY